MSFKRSPFGALQALAYFELSPAFKLYATGGLKFYKIKIKGSYKFLGQTATNTSNKTELTPVVGAGLQMDFKNRWFGRLEYIHELKENINNTPKKSAVLGMSRSKLSSHCIRLAVGYKF